MSCNSLQIITNVTSGTASSWEYSFYVPHDMASLLELMGGSDEFVRRLDAFFDLGFHDIG